MRINPFNLDAATASENEIATLVAQGGTEIQDFCGQSNQIDDWHNYGSRVLRARKGFGKSHLITKRSINHRNSKAAIQTLFYPTGGFPRYVLDPLTDLDGLVPRWLEGKDAIDAWVSVWQIAITGLLVWICDVDAANLRGYSSWFGSLESLNNPNAVGESGKQENGQIQGKLTMFMGRVIQKINEADNYTEGNKILSAGLFVANSDWASAVGKRLDAIKKFRVALYLDGPDEMVSMARDNLWRNVQQGLLMAVWRFSKNNPWSRLLHIYASVRSEAFGSEEDHANIKMAESLVMPLHYTRQELEAIVNDRIRLAESMRLMTPITDSPLAALCGFSQVTHHDRQNLDGSNYCEGIFDAILRHTREIPRELIAMASAIYNIDRELRNQNAVKLAVNATASQNIVDSIKHSFLGWDDAKHRLLAMKIDRQVMDKDHLMKLVNDADQHGSSIVKLFIQHGLLGVSERQPQRHRSFFMQQFAFDQVHGDEKSSSLTKDFYFVHPAFKEWIISRPEYINQSFIRSTSGAIGNGIPYQSRQPNICLEFEENNGVIIFGNTSARLTASRKSISYPLKFLFMCLLVCRLHKRITVSLELVFELKKRIENSNSPLKSIVPPFDMKTDAEYIRDWCKKICADSNIHAYLQALFPERVWGKKNIPKFISFSAISAAGAAMTMSIPDLDLQELDFSDNLNALLGALPK